jgi:hypothetical protein
MDSPTVTSNPKRRKNSMGFERREADDIRTINDKTRSKG